MITLPNLVQEFNIRHLTNSVLVGTMKFTLDQLDAFFTPSNPAPSRLAAQILEYRGSYNRLNAAYALTRESLLTGNIYDLDKEGDSLYQGIKDTSEAAQRMTYLAARKDAGDRVSLTVKKYKVNTKENFISEWSKLQQLCEEINTSTQLTTDIATLGLTEATARLTAIADLLRDTLTERSNELPSQKAMQQAREAIYLEYRALIDVLNGTAIVDENPNRYATLIQALNRNIDYVRVHAMTNGGATNGSNGGDGSNGSNGQNGNNEGGETPDPGTGGDDGGQQGGGQQGGETPVNPGGGDTPGGGGGSNPEGDDEN